MKKTLNMMLFSMILLLVSCSNSTFKITLDYDNELNNQIIKVNKNDILTFDEPTKEGYTFKYWMNTETNEKFNVNTKISQNYHLIAIYEKNVYYTITFDSSPFDSQEVIKGELAVDPGVPEILNYNFIGWSIDNSDQLFDFSKEVNQHYFLIPVYEEEVGTGLYYRMIQTSSGNYYMATLIDGGPKDVVIPNIYQNNYINELSSSSGGSNIERITIHKYVISIDVDFFTSAFDLKEIVVDKDNTSFYSEDGILYKKFYEDLNILFYPINKTNEYYLINENVGYISGNAFQLTKGIETLNLNNGNLKEIRAHAFNFSEIKKIIVPDNIMISDNAFYNYKNGNIFLMSDSYNFVVDRTTNVYTVDEWELVNSVPTLK